MIETLELHNWLPYGDVTLKFPRKPSVIAVLGQNGKGKSSLLEAARFCLFGEGRDEQVDLVRLGADEMSVTMIMGGIPKTGQKLKVMRSINEKGAGKTQVWVNSRLVQKGGARPDSKNKAQEFLNTVLGTEDFFFTLTSFFGFGISDNLMQVRPSERLETMQKLAKVDACGQINKIAGRHRSKLEDARGEKRIRITALKETTDDLDSLKAALKDTRNRISDNLKLQDKRQAERISFVKDLDRFQAVTRENDSLKKDKKNLNGELEDLAVDEQEMQSALESAKERSAKFVKNKALYQKELEENKSDSAALARMTSDLTEWKLIRDLKRQGLKSDAHKNECPLCASPLDPAMRGKWKEDLEILDAKILKLSEKVEGYRKLVTRKQDLKDALASADEEIIRLSKNSDDLSQKISENVHKSHEVKAEIEKVTERLKFIADNGLIDKYDEILERMQQTDEKINGIQREIGRLTEAEKRIEADIESASDRQDEIEKLESEIKTLDRHIAAYSLVEKGFSRYEIPVTLLKNLRSAVEQRATTIIKQFVDARVRIIDTEGARPGIEFVLVDEVGRRKYRLLSTGEKVLVFLAVRLALTEIINSDKNSRLDFLVLDEVVGNIDSEKREALTRFINTTLKKHFKQIFVMSHVPFRNIFDEILKVEKIDGLAVVRKVAAA